MTSSIDDPSVTEITALLQDNAIIPTTTTASPVIHEEWKPTWYWPWKPSYWPAIVLVFLLNLTAGSIAALSTIFLRELFCERGIPKLFPIFGDSKDGSIINPDDPNCESAEYSIAIAKFVGVSVTMAAILVTLTLRYWSALSDRIGRKRTILICNLGVAVSCAIQVYVRVNSEVNVLWLLFAVVIESLTGAGALLDALIHAYCSDLTLPEERIVVFGRIFAGSYAGLAAGSAIGGIAAEKFGLDFVFIWLAPSLLFLLCLYSMIMPESLTAATMSKNRENYKKSAVILVDETEQPDPKKQEKRSLKEHITSFINGFMPDKLPNRLAGKYSIPILMLSGTIATGAIIAANLVAPTYMLYIFRWSEARLSFFFTISGISRVISMTLFLPFVKKFAPHSVLNDPSASISYDLKLVVIGVFIESITFFVYGATPVGEGFYVGGMLSSFGTMYAPAFRGILTQSVPAEQVGQTLGTAITLELLIAMVVPLGVSWLYGVTLETWPSAVFYICGLVGLASCALAFSVLFTHNKAMRH